MNVPTDQIERALKAVESAVDDLANSLNEQLPEPHERRQARRHVRAVCDQLTRNLVSLGELASMLADVAKEHHKLFDQQPSVAHQVALDLHDAYLKPACLRRR